MMNDDQSGKIAGEIYEPVLLALIAEEAARKASLEQRAVAVVTTSGLLVSLLVALSTLGFGKDSLATATPPEA